MATNRPEIIFLAAATVGGILANDSRSAEFIYDNLATSRADIELRRTAATGRSRAVSHEP